MAVPVSPIVTEHRIIAIPSLAARRARELFSIHDAICWAKRQGLRCSHCADLRTRAERLERQP